MITIKVEHKDVTKMLGELQAKMKNLTPVMKIIGQVIRDSVVKNFEAGGRPVKWKPSARARIQGGQTLTDSGILRKSFTSKAYSDKAVIGTIEKYAAIHHFGGKTGRNNKVKMPKRPFLMVQAEDWTEIKNVVQDYLLKK